MFDESLGERGMGALVMDVDETPLGHWTSTKVASSSALKAGNEFLVIILVETAAQ